MALEPLELRDHRYRAQKALNLLKDESQAEERRALEEQIAHYQEICPHEHAEEVDGEWRCKDCDLQKTTAVPEPEPEPEAAPEPAPEAASEPEPEPKAAPEPAEPAPETPPSPVAEPPAPEAPAQATPEEEPPAPAPAATPDPSEAPTEETTPIDVGDDDESKPSNG